MPASRALPLLLSTILLAVPPQARTEEIIAPADAAAYVGRLVTVEGDVVDARLETDGLVLDLVPDDPKGFRIVLALALISDLPRHPERLYAGRRIRVTAPMRQFRGRPEMVIQVASQIEVVDVAAPAPAPTTTTTPPAPSARATPPPPTTTTTTTAPAPSARAVPSPLPTAAPSPPPPPPPPSPRPDVAPPPVAPAARPAPAEAAPEPSSERPLLSERIAAARCDSARARWREAAERVEQESAALRSCLDAATYRCRERAAALAPALTDLEWAEQQVAERCD